MSCPFRETEVMTIFPVRHVLDPDKHILGCIVSDPQKSSDPGLGKAN